MDGESIGMQIRRVETWLTAPSDKTFEEAAAALDPTRQLVLWDDDLRPAPDAYDVSWQWFMEVGQLCVCVCTNAIDGGNSSSTTYYDWSATDCAARVLVCCAKALRSSERSVADDIAALGRAVSERFARRG
jgi:hypothetical protein